METALTTQQHTGHLDALELIDQANLADSTKRQYRRALQPYLDQGHTLGNPEALATYARGLGESRRRMLKSALALVGDRLAKRIKAGATPENVATTTATLMRLEALPDLVETTAPKGQKAHTWLTPAQVKRVMGTCGDDLTGQRDRVVLGLLVGAGLRRDELAGLTWEHIKWQPAGDKIRTVVEVTGKGDKIRVIPISDKLAGILDQWANVTGREGNVARSLGMAQELGGSISGVGIFDIVRKHGGSIGLPTLAPHDLRRTYARIGYDAGIPIPQISLLLGHADIKTTMVYLGITIDLEATASDSVPLG